MECYWRITLWDGTSIRVRPANAQAVKDKMAKDTGHIITSNRTIAVKDIKTFEETDERVSVPALSSGELLADADAAFGQTSYSDLGHVVSVAVKKTVSLRKWETYYANISAYHRLSDDGDHVTIGFWLPKHLVNTENVQYCTPDEILLLERR